MKSRSFILYFNFWHWCNVFLLVITLSSALMLVYTKFLNRSVTSAIHSETSRQEQLDTEWSQLLLEESALAGQQRIETLARNKLKMHRIQPKDVVVIKP